ncbi:MAG: hypothetical protein RL518_459 [Pseudomonadota bacterium]|jgi:hypothetical protein
MTIRHPKPAHSESGFIVLMFMLMVAVLLTSVAFAVDVGRAYDTQRQLQIVADTAALSAAGALGSTTSYAHVVSVVADIARANGATADEVMVKEPRCGTWENDTFVPNSARACSSSANAVEVTVVREIPTNFARLIKKYSFNLQASAVAHLPPPEGGNCIRPFGVEQSYLDTLSVPEGGLFTVSGAVGAGNWGKIDLNGNASSGEEYTRLMLNNLCDEAITPGGYVSSGTGNAQIEQVFQALLQDTAPPLAATNMILAVTSDFENGNSLVQIQRFIKVDLLSQQGTGPRWRATFRIVEWDAQPEPPVSPSRRLMK